MTLTLSIIAAAIVLLVTFACFKVGADSEGEW